MDVQYTPEAHGLTRIHFTGEHNNGKPMTTDTSHTMQQYSISDVERETGITREILRIWERRYGFPAPARDSQGDRVYQRDDVDALRRVRRLMDAGHRPGRIFSQGLHLSGAAERTADAGRRDPLHRELIDCLKQHHAEQLEQWLVRQMENGLKAFILRHAARFTEWVGESWAAGELEVFEEHLFTETLEKLLRSRYLPLQPAAGAPQVLLTTASGELHGLGLLMSEGVLRLAGCRVTSLGTNTPVDEIASAARATGCEVVALSFSAAFAPRQARAELLRLREQLDPACGLWAGGGGIAALKQNLPGVRLMDSLELLDQAAQALRSGAV